MHSKPKLALAILTSPSAAFEEILERRLLGTALLIVAITGLLSMVPIVKQISTVGPAQVFALGKNNPLTWLGLCMLYAFVLRGILKWVGTQIEYSAVLTVLGWSHVALLIHQIASCFWVFIAVNAPASSTAAQFLFAIGTAMPIWYLIIVGLGIRAASGLPLMRGVMSYVVVGAAATIAFDLTYAMARVSQFNAALPGIRTTAQMLVAFTPLDPWQKAPDQLPRLAAAAVGAVLGLWHLGKVLEWEEGMHKRAAASAGIIGILIAGIYFNAQYRVDYYGRLARAQQLYNLERYEECAEKLVEMLPILNKNAALMLDISDSYYRANKPKSAISYYDSFVKLVDDARIADAEKSHLYARAYTGYGDVYFIMGDGKKSTSYYRKCIAAVEKRDSKEETKPQQSEQMKQDTNIWLARAHSGIGSVYDQQGDYESALKEFKKAAEIWPEFRDPWIRMAVTYNRTEDHDKAIEAANHAIKKLGSEAAIAWVALAQAFVQTGDEKQAVVAITMAAQRSEELSGRMGEKTEGWEDAVAKLAPFDLKFPMEEDAASQPDPKQQAAEDKEEPSEDKQPDNGNNKDE